MAKGKIVHTEHGEHKSVDVEKASYPLDGTWYQNRDRDTGQVTTQTKNRAYAVEQARKQTGN